MAAFAKSWGREQRLRSQTVGIITNHLRGRCAVSSASRSAGNNIVLALSAVNLDAPGMHWSA
jgi:hypothetical protein